MTTQTIYSVYVYGEHSAHAGRRAWPDLDDDSECMDDYVHYEGSADDLLDVAASLHNDGTKYGCRASAVLLDEILIPVP